MSEARTRRPAPSSSPRPEVCPEHSRRARPEGSGGASGQVVWTEKTRQDLREIVRYLRQHSPEAAERISKEIIASTRRLETLPFSGRIVPELANTSFREVIIGDYRVIYDVTEGKTVEILTIVHSKRLLPRIKELRE